MPSIDPFSVIIFLAVVGLVLVIAATRDKPRDRIAERVASLSGELIEPPRRGVLAKLAAFAAKLAGPLLPTDQARRAAIRERLTHAGIYHRQASAVYLGVQITLVVAPLALAVAMFIAGAVSFGSAAAGAIIGAAIGFIIPGLWLDARKKTRQTELRRGLPDFFDILVLCLEGGTSFLHAWQSVADELEESHPSLWLDLQLVAREVELGRPAGEALRHFADRTDLDEVVSLASVIGQAERLGTELIRPLRSLSDQLRMKRVRIAEEAAHQASTAILFPTLLLIFPGVLAIILGPMVLQTLNIFTRIAQ